MISWWSTISGHPAVKWVLASFLTVQFLRLATTAMYQGLHHTILRLKTKAFNDRRRFTMGKSLRFTIPNIKRMIRVSHHGGQAMLH